MSGGGGYDVDEDRRRGGGGESPIAAGRVPAPPTISGTGSAHHWLTHTPHRCVCTPHGAAAANVPARPKEARACAS